MRGNVAFAKFVSINQSFVKYIRLTKTQSNLQASVKNLRPVGILIQLPSNKISIVFLAEGSGYNVGFEPQSFD